MTQQVWIKVTGDAPNHVHKAVSDLWCDLMDRGIGAVKDEHRDGGFSIIWSQETQDYHDERENRVYDENRE
jgi:hypothetical protein